MRTASRASQILAELSRHHVDIAAVQETHFTSEEDSRLLAQSYHIYSAYGESNSRGVSILMNRDLNARVDVVFAGIGGRLIVVDCTI